MKTINQVTYTNENKTDVEKIMDNYLKKYGHADASAILTLAEIVDRQLWKLNTTLRNRNAPRSN